METGGVGLSPRYCVEPVIGRDGTTTWGEVVQEDIAVTAVNAKARYDLMAVGFVSLATSKSTHRQ